MELVDMHANTLDQSISVVTDGCSSRPTMMVPSIPCFSELLGGFRGFHLVSLRLKIPHHSRVDLEQLTSCLCFVLQIARSTASKLHQSEVYAYSDLTEHRFRWLRVLHTHR